MESKIRQFWAILAAVLLCCMGFGQIPEESRDNIYVRVAVFKNVKQFPLSIRGRYKMVDVVKGDLLNEDRRLKRTDVMATAQGIKVGGVQYYTRYLRIKPKKDVSLYRNNKEKRYRGFMDVILGEDGTFLVINRIELESYVKGVLYHEVPHYWPMNAIKAQAIATRTYAYYQIQQRKNVKFDVTSDIYSQVYGGRSAERYRSNIAANRTRGQILTYQGEVLPAYFSSTCGGRTEDVDELWKHNLPPLKGKKCSFCVRSPHYRWKKNFRSKDIQEKLNKNGFKLGLIKEIKVTSRNNSDRVKQLTITTRDGKKDTISGVRFREIIGPNILKSNFYDIEMQGYYFDVKGRGWGHGVGMCQWGALYMAKERYKYTSILDYYYPGAKTTNIEDL